MFKTAIVRKPAKNFQFGLTTSNLGKPEYHKALFQHSAYIKALKTCGLEIKELEPNEQFPDSTFVEDTAVVNEDIAIITNLGAPCRRGEEIEIMRVLEEYFDIIELIKSPGTLDGGDVLRIENQYYIGLSGRTNQEGANQVIRILEKYGYSCSTVLLSKFLHLKSGVSYIGDDNLITAGEFIDKPIFREYNIIKVEEDESYAANCVKINDYILFPKGFKNLRKKVEELNYKIIEVDMSEFRKMDGGLSCLSIRF